MSWSDKNESKESLSTPKIFGVEKGPKIEFLNKKRKGNYSIYKSVRFQKVFGNLWSLQPVQK